MTKTKLFKLIGATVLSSVISIFSFQANAIERNGYNGNQCMTTNTATGANFQWAYNGLKNLSNVDRWVICPYVIDDIQWDGSPNLFLEVNMYMPAGYHTQHGGSRTGQPCFARQLVAHDNVDNSNQTTQFNVAFTAGFFDGTNFLGDSDSSGISSIATNADLANGYILCKVPKNGGELRQYRVWQQ